MLNSLIGVIASSGGAAAAASSYESIATATVGSGGTGTITFSSIPATYTHLQIRFLSGFTSAGQAVRLRLNGDTGTNYSVHGLYGSGTAAGSYSEINQNRENIYGAISGTSTTYPSACVADIFDYASTSKYKTTRSLAGNDTNGGGEIALFSGLWMSTSAVTSIDIFPSAGNFTQYSSFALYGIKGA